LGIFLVSAVSRIGDTGSHGGANIGSIISGSPNVNAGGVAVARNGDEYSCPVHGTQSLISNSTVKANGESVVTVGCAVTCGAVIDTGLNSVQAPEG
jgi:uncharacterized Zn-binding protein involved in type VI secretion